ncbi:hypothetical protein [Bradyrhizobium genosp. SA-3]|uniref:hypothetical protein n=1 Tax=Bradyrhizobium genosp. SA-3 TaxID=508868 RepID=UPI003D9AF1E1
MINRTMQIHGAAGCTESRLAHWCDQQRLARIYEGPLRSPQVSRARASFIGVSATPHYMK